MSNPFSQTVSIYRGQTASFVLSVLDEDGEPFSLGGHTLHMHIKERASDPDPPIVSVQTGAGITHRASPEDHKADIVITSSQTIEILSQDNVFDVWLVKTSGDRSPIIGVRTLRVLTPVSTPAP